MRTILRLIRLSSQALLLFAWSPEFSRARRCPGFGGSGFTGLGFRIWGVRKQHSTAPKHTPFNLAFSFTNVRGSLLEEQPLKSTGAHTIKVTVGSAFLEAEVA